MRTGSSFSQDTCFLRCSPALLQSIELSIIGLSGNKSSKCHNQGSIGSDRAPWLITLHIQALRGATFSPRVLTGYTTGNVMINLERNSRVLGRQHPPGNLSLNMSACKFQEFINFQLKLDQCQEGLICSCLLKQSITARKRKQTIMNKIQASMVTDRITFYKYNFPKPVNTHIWLHIYMND